MNRVLLIYYFIIHHTINRCLIQLFSGSKSANDLCPQVNKPHPQQITLRHIYHLVMNQCSHNHTRPSALSNCHPLCFTGTSGVSNNATTGVSNNASDKYFQDPVLNTISMPEATLLPNYKSISLCFDGKGFMENGY